MERGGEGRGEEGRGGEKRGGEGRVALLIDYFHVALLRLCFLKIQLFGIHCNVRVATGQEMVWEKKFFKDRKKSGNFILSQDKLTF